MAARLGGISSLLLIIWLFALEQVVSRSHQLQSFSSEVSILLRRAQNLEKQKKLSELMQKQSQLDAPDYLHQVVEKIPLLQGEKHRVELLAKRFPDNPSLKERILFLDSDQSQVRFDEIHATTSPDVEYHLTRHIQMDKNDLKNFFESVEAGRSDATQKKPFLLMKKFELLKCYEKGDEKVYSIYAELLKKS